MLLKNTTINYMRRLKKKLDYQKKNIYIYIRWSGHYVILFDSYRVNRIIITAYAGMHKILSNPLYLIIKNILFRLFLTPVIMF